MVIIKRARPTEYVSNDGAEVEAVRRRRLRAAAGVVALIVAALGGTVLLAWLMHGELVARLTPRVASMKANTALACLAGGVALWILNRPGLSRRQLWVGRVLGGLIGLIGLVTLVEYAGGWSLGVDELLARDPPGAVSTSHPGRMAPTTALAFLLLGLAVAGIDSRFAGGTLAAIAAGLIGLMAGVGYLLGVEGFYSVGDLTRMNPATAGAIVFLSAGVLLARPERGVMQVATSETFGGLFLRRSVPAAAVGVVLIAWVRLQGQKGGLFGTEAGLLLVVGTTLVLFTLLVVRVAREIHATEIARRAAEESRSGSERELRAQKSLARRAVEELNRRQAAEAARLAEANRELESFAYSVSHDLRAPLRHIQGFATLLGDHLGAGLDEKGARYLHLITDAAIRMGHLTDDMLKFSRAGRTAIERRCVDLPALVTSVIAEVELDSPGRGIEWVVGGLSTVLADHGLLRQVMFNLLSNAVKYTGPRDPARIEVGGYSDAGEDTVFVRDNGVGFDQSHASKLFNVFQRLHSEEEFEGTGIGLAIVRRIVERHGGKVRAKGAVGQGATFSFSLPRKDPETPRSRSETE